MVSLVEGIEQVNEVVKDKWVNALSAINIFCCMFDVKRLCMHVNPYMKVPLHPRHYSFDGGTCPARAAICLILQGIFPLTQSIDINSKANFPVSNLEGILFMHDKS